MRYGYWLPVFGGWLRNVEDEGMEASWAYVRRLAQRSEQIGYDLTLIAELFLNDIDERREWDVHPGSSNTEHGTMGHIESVLYGRAAEALVVEGCVVAYVGATPRGDEGFGGIVKGLEHRREAFGFVLAPLAKCVDLPLEAGKAAIRHHVSDGRGLYERVWPTPKSSSADTCRAWPISDRAPASFALRLNRPRHGSGEPRRP